MAPKILFAEQRDEEDLNEILMEYGMGFPGSIEEQLIVKENDRVVAGSKIAEYQKDRYFLEVLGVKKQNLGQGIGRFLLSEIIRNPWKYCRNSLSSDETRESFQIETVARGYAVGFYKKLGFSPCDFREIPDLYREQCRDCPEREACDPVPMNYIGGI